MKYTKKTKLKMIELKRKGIHPIDIFKIFKYDISNKSKEYPVATLRKWERELERKGIDKAFINSDRKGRKKKILSKNWEKEIEKLSDKEKLKWMKAKIKLMEKESVLFPNLRKEVKLRKTKEFEIVYQVKKENKEIELDIFLIIMNLSKSGYYKYLKEKEKRKEKDWNLFLNILEIFNKYNQRKGYRQIAMDLKKS